MTIHNRRLREVQDQIKACKTLMEYSTTLSETLMYNGKLESLEKEEKEILSKYEVEQ